MGGRRGDEGGGVRGGGGKVRGVIPLLVPAADSVPPPL